MKKFIIIGIIVLLTGGLSIGGYFLLKPNPKPPVDPTEPLTSISFAGVDHDEIPFGSDYNVLTGVTATGNEGTDFTDLITFQTLGAVSSDGVLDTSIPGITAVRYEVRYEDILLQHWRNITVLAPPAVEGELIYNGTFLAGLAGWMDSNVNLAVEGAEMDMRVVDGILEVDVLTAAEQYTPRFGQMNVAFEEGKTYRITFEVKASVARTIYFQVGQVLSATPWFIHFLEQDPISGAFGRFLDITTEWQTFEFVFTQNLNNLDGGIVFELGKMPGSADGTLYFDNIAATELDVTHVAFELNGGSRVSDLIIDRGETIEAPTPIRYGYLFTGWFVDADVTQSFDFSQPIDDDLILYAAWDLDENVTINPFIINPEFDYDTLGWDDPSIILQSDNDNSRMNMRVIDGVLEVEVENHLHQYTPRFGQMNMPFVNGKSYEISFEVKADHARTIHFMLGELLQEAPWFVYFANLGATTAGAFVEVSTEWEAVTFRFTHTRNNQRGGIVFELGVMPGLTGVNTTLYFDNFNIREIELVTVSFNTNGGSLLANATLENGMQLLEPTVPTKTGFDFIGWFVNQNLEDTYDFTNGVTENMTLYAKWERDPDYDFGSYLINPDFAQGTLGWADSSVNLYSDNDNSSMNFAVVDDILEVDVVTDIYQYAPRFGQMNVPFQQGNSYEVSFKVRADAVKTVHFMIGEQLNQSPWFTHFASIGSTTAGTFIDITPEWQTFTYAFTQSIDNQRGGILFELGVMPGQTGVSTTLYFEYFSVREIELVTVNFNSVGGTVIAPASFESGLTVAEPTDPTKLGFVFSGWYTSQAYDEAFDFSNGVIETITLYAKWEEDPDYDFGDYLINPDFEYGTYGWEDSEVNFAENATLNFSVVDGVLEVQTVTSGNQYSPRFGQMNVPFQYGRTYQVSFEVKASAARMVYFLIGEQLNSEPWFTSFLPLIDYRPGRFLSIGTEFETFTFTFTHNQHNQRGGIMFELGRIAVSGIPSVPTNFASTLYFNYFSVVDLSADVTFETDGGSVVDPLIVEKGTTFSQPEAPTKDLHTFGGWFIDQETTIPYNFATPVTENLTLYAKWNPTGYAVSVFNGTESSTTYYQPLEIASVTAAPDVGDDVFSYWLLNGQIVSTMITYAFTVTDHTELEAVYGVVYEAEAAVYLYEDLQETNGEHTFISQVSLPEGYTLISYGYLTSDNAVELTHSTSGVEVHTMTTYDEQTNEFIESFVWNSLLSIRAFAIYEDLNGDTHTAYSNSHLYQVPQIKLISVGYGHTIAVTSDDRVFTWGWQYPSAWGTGGHLGTGENEQVLAPLEITHQFEFQENETIISVIAAYAHTMLLTSEGRLYVFGIGGAGRLGTGSTASQLTPVEITHQFDELESDEKIVEIFAGKENHNFAITSLGKIFAWGSNANGRLGDGTTTHRNTPVNITSQFGLIGSEQVMSLNSGRHHSLALTSAGRVFTWGVDGAGQLGNGEELTDDVLTPTDITSRFILLEGETIVDVSAGEYHNLAVTSLGRVFSWGSNVEGRLGIGTAGGNSPSPVLVTFPTLHEGETIVSVEAGYIVSTVRTSQNRIFGWGAGYPRVLANNNGSNVLSPALVATFTGANSLQSGEYVINYSIGYEISMFLTSNGRIFGAGRAQVSSGSGNIPIGVGDGTTTGRNTPFNITNKFPPKLSE